MTNNKLQSLTEIFNERIFRIPDFQRGYSWQEPQLEDFWDDLVNLKEGRIHYTGLLTVEEVKKEDVLHLEKWQEDLWLIESGLSAYHVIDGQQRLTTAIIFINQLLKQFNDDEGINFKKKDYWITKFLFQQYDELYKSYIFGYEKDNPSDEYFKTKILEQESSTADKVPEQTLYTANLKFANDFFKTKFTGLSKEKMQAIFKKITGKLKFNLYTIDDELDVYVTFETMNNRGKPLSNLELLKNRLIYLTTLIDGEESNYNQLRKDINETWKTIYEYLGKNKDKPMDDDEFLRNHWTMYFNYERKQSAAYAKFLLNQKFTSKNALNGTLKKSDIKEYIDSLSESIKSWFYLYNPEFSTYGEETKEWLQKLNRLGMSAFPPLIMAGMTKCSEEDKLLSLLRSVESFIFLVFRLSQRPSNTKNSHFYRLANSFYFEKDETDIDSVIMNIEWMINRNEEGETSGWFNLEKFKHYISDKYDKGEGFYSWNGLRYFLYEYELYLQNKANGNQKVSWNDFNRRLKDDTIEHIYPQTPKDECWSIGYSGYNENDKMKILHSLGNLVLLSQSKNSELQNKCFDFKKRHLDTNNTTFSGFYNGSYSEIQVSNYEKWTPDEILKRGFDMLDFLEERWKIDFNDWENIAKEDILQIKFVNKQLY
ncbi:DUF262 domain-containing HNH endonuclease family protein [Methanolobus sp. ZRKC5]|uniref:DUF262 domain-containing protein n=1 Tax=unclassified Methanolobus TaxID=2629569 RepID=UPI00313B2AA9